MASKIEIAGLKLRRGCVLPLTLAVGVLAGSCVFCADQVNVAYQAWLHGRTLPSSTPALVGTPVQTAFETRIPWPTPGITPIATLDAKTKAMCMANEGAFGHYNKQFLPVPNMPAITSDSFNPKTGGIKYDSINSEEHVKGDFAQWIYNYLHNADDKDPLVAYMSSMGVSKDNYGVLLNGADVDKLTVAQLSQQKWVGLFVVTAEKEPMEAQFKIIAQTAKQINEKINPGSAASFDEEKYIEKLRADLGVTYEDTFGDKTVTLVKMSSVGFYINADVKGNNPATFDPKKDFGTDQNNYMSGKDRVGFFVSFGKDAENDSARPIVLDDYAKIVKDAKGERVWCPGSGNVPTPIETPVPVLTPPTPVPTATTPPGGPGPTDTPRPPGATETRIATATVQPPTSVPSRTPDVRTNTPPATTPTSIPSLPSSTPAPSPTPDSRPTLPPNTPHASVTPG